MAANQTKADFERSTSNNESGVAQAQFLRGIKAYPSERTSGGIAVLKATMGRYPERKDQERNPYGHVRVYFDADKDQIISIGLDVNDVARGCRRDAQRGVHACGVYIHKGTTCEEAEKVLDTHWNRETLEEDPWEGKIKYKSNRMRQTMTNEIVMGSGNGYGVCDNEGRVVVLYGRNGGRLSCGVLEASDVPSSFECQEDLPNSEHGTEPKAPSWPSKSSSTSQPTDEMVPSMPGQSTSSTAFAAEAVTTTSAIFSPVGNASGPSPELPGSSVASTTAPNETDTSPSTSSQSPGSDEYLASSASSTTTPTEAVDLNATTGQAFAEQANDVPSLTRPTTTAAPNSSPTTVPTPVSPTTTTSTEQANAFGPSLTSPTGSPTMVPSSSSPPSLVNNTIVDEAETAIQIGPKLGAGSIAGIAVGVTLGAGLVLVAMFFAMHAWKSNGRIWNRERGTKKNGSSKEDLPVKSSDAKPTISVFQGSISAFDVTRTFDSNRDVGSVGQT